MEYESNIQTQNPGLRNGMLQKNRRSHKKRQITKFGDSDKTELELWYWSLDPTKTPELFRPCSQNESKQIFQHSHARSCPRQQESRETKEKMDRCDKRRLPYDECRPANRYSHGARQKFLEEVRGRAVDACRWDIAKAISQVMIHSVSGELSFPLPMYTPIPSIERLSIPELWTTQSDHITIICNGQRACALSWIYHRGAGKQNDPHFWNPLSHCAFSLCHIRGATTKIKPCIKRKIAFFH